ncbi:MAG: transposase, partial [Nitrospirales bacterium]|nr:transposase [Nitrospirales bacterium]
SILKNAGDHSIREFLTDNIQARSTLRTDGWRGYTNAALVGYTHRVRLVRTPERASKGAPHIHRVFSNLKAWLNGTHHGVEPKYLQTIWTSLCSASTDARRQWQRFRLYSESQRRKPRYR